MKVTHSLAGPFLDLASGEAAWLADHTVVGINPDTINSFTSDVDAPLSEAVDSSTTKTISTTANSNAAAGSLFPLAVRILSGTGTLPKIELNSDGLWYPERIARTGDVIKLQVRTPSGSLSDTVVRLFYPGGYSDWLVTTVQDAPVGYILRVQADENTYTDAGTTPANDNELLQEWGVLSQSTSGERPTLQTNEVNGMPVVRFDGSDDYMDTVLDGTAVTEATVGITFKTNSTLVNGGVFQWATTLNDGSPFILIQSHLDDTRIYFDNSYWFTFSHAPNVWKNIILTWDGTTWRVYLDGVLFDTKVTGSANKSNAASAFLGNGYNNFSNADVLDLFIYDSVVPFADLADFMLPRAGL
jgi:hypothetical protein